MKKLLAACGALLLLVGFAATGARSQVCFDFTVYCDGLELATSGSGGQISGWWRNTDCAGTDVAVSGTRVHGDPGGAGWVVCDWPADPCPVGHDWGFYIDDLDGTMDMYSDTGGGWQIWIDDLAFTNFQGPCPFAPEPGTGPRESTTMTQPEYDE